MCAIYFLVNAMWDEVYKCWLWGILDPQVDGSCPIILVFILKVLGFTSLMANYHLVGVTPFHVKHLCLKQVYTQSRDGSTWTHDLGELLVTHLCYYYVKFIIGCKGGNIQFKTPIFIPHMDHVILCMHTFGLGYFTS